MTRAPHYLAFARALALVSAAAAPGCYQAHERPTDAGPPVDGGPLADAEFSCSSCVCSGAETTCGTLGHLECCFRTGPIAPPDLPHA